MKRYFVFLSLLLPLYGFSQSSIDKKQQDLLGQGHLHLGVNVSGGYGDNAGAVGQVTPRVQYFLKDGWSIAAEGRYVRTGPDFTYAGGGLSTRYYFLRGNRFAFFGQLGATYGQSTYRTVDPFTVYQSLLSGIEPFTGKSSVWQADAGVGAHYRVGNRWSVEAVVERTQYQRTYLIPDFSRWQGSVGINYRIK